jgi:hypothetical protein
LRLAQGFGQPGCYLIVPKIERERFEPVQDRREKIAHRVPPARARVIDDDYPAAGPDDSQRLGQRIATPRCRLLMQKKEQDRAVVARGGNVERGRIHQQMTDQRTDRQLRAQIVELHRHGVDDIETSRRRRNPLQKQICNVAIGAGNLNRSPG